MEDVNQDGISENVYYLIGESHDDSAGELHDEEFLAPGSGKISCILRRGILPLYIKCGAQSHAVYSVIENIT
jgi:hypothetical protein